MQTHPSAPKQQPKLLDQLRNAIRVRAPLHPRTGEDEVTHESGHDRDADDAPEAHQTEPAQADATTRGLIRAR